MRLPELRCQGSAHTRDTVHTAKMPQVRCHNDKGAVENGVEIVLHPNPILRTHATPVERVGKKERRFLRQMLKHMRRWKGIGLAAPQVASLQQLITVEVNGEVLLWANPKILDEHGTGHMEEGCLSIPDTFVNVKRAAGVWVQALNIDNRSVELKIDGLLGRVVQHEIDHLNGVLTIDHGPAVEHRSAKQDEA